MTPPPALLLIGVGRFGGEHLDEWLELARQGRVRVAGLVVASEASARVLASRTQLPVHVGFDAALLVGVDAVDIATPSSTHAGLVAACLPHAHVLVEKPLAADTAHARTLQALADAHGNMLMVGHIYHHHPLTTLLRDELARTGEPPQTLELEFSNPHELRADSLDPFDEWIHAFDLLRICVPGAVISCRAWRSGSLVEASVALKGGTRAVLRFGWGGVERVRRVRVGYADRRVTANFLDGNLTVHCLDRTDKRWVGAQPQALGRELRCFLDAIAGAALPVPSAADVQATLALARRARASAAAAEPAIGKARKDRPRVAVLGGGVFGATCAIELARSCDVVLFERHAALLTEASYLNQWRHHSGFHYPRSLETIQEVQRTKADFESAYEPAIVRDVQAYYAVSAWGSEITAQRYLATCKANDLRFRQVPPPQDVVYPERLSVCLLTDEAVVEIGKLGKLLMKLLRGNRHIDLRLSTEVRSGRLLSDGRKRLVVPGSRVADEGYDFVVNASYANTNRVAGWFGFARRPLRFDLLEMAVVEIPGARRFMMTILDAPFTSLTSVGSGDLFMLSHIHESILASQVPADGLPPAWGCWSSNRDNLMRHGLRYLPILKNARHVESRVGVRTVEAYREDFDGRPTVITPHGFGCWSVLGGKIVTAVTNARELARAIARESGHA